MPWPQFCPHVSVTNAGTLRDELVQSLAAAIGHPLLNASGIGRAALEDTSQGLAGVQGRGGTGLSLAQLDCHLWVRSLTPTSESDKCLGLALAL